jgi:ribosomal protein S18 acetylase RimI-like enzyme
MSESAEIRALRDSEIPALCALAREIWRAHYPGIISVAQIEYMLEERYTETVIRAELKRKDLWWDVLMADNVMTGYASYFLTGSAAELKLDKLYLHPRAHRQGYGAMLVDHVLSFMAGVGCTHLTLAVNRRNQGAIAAYLKYGFRVIETSIREIGEGFVMDDYIMVKEIA